MEKVISCCGVVCSECQYYPNECKGCPTIKGQVFWLEYTGGKVCEIYECCVQMKKLAHCGKCANLPCDRFDGIDPTKTQEENDNDYRQQIAQLASMK